MRERERERRKENSSREKERALGDAMSFALGLVIWGEREMHTLGASMIVSFIPIWPRVEQILGESGH